MAVYFIGDTHFGHKDIHLKFRPGFESVEHHDQTVAENILRTCGKRDTLYILGDVVINRASMHWLEKICEQTEYVRVVLGNHDSKERKTTPSVRELFEAGVHEVYGIRDYKRAWLTHCPIHPQEMRNRILNIHGHIHDSTVNWPFVEQPDDRYFNVSCEKVDYTPIEFTKILKTIGHDA